MFVHNIVHVIRREMLPNILLGRELRKRGIEVELEFMQLASTPLDINRKGPHLRVIPFLYNDYNTYKNLTRTRWCGEAVLNLCWENFRNKWNRKNLIPEGTLVEKGAVCLSWGEKFARILGEHDYPKDNIRVAGNMRLDLPFHRDLLFSREFLAKRYGLNPDRPWLLIPWNLQIANRDNPDFARVREHHGLEFPEDIVACAEKTLEYHYELLRKLPDALPDHEVIVRMHPSDRAADQIRKQGEGFKERLHLIDEFDLMNWVMQSRVVLGWTSTSLLEAVAAKIPAVSFEPVPYTEPFDYDVGRILKPTTTIDETIAAIQNPEGLLEHTNTQLFKEWFGDVDGNAHKRVADVCEAMLKNYDAHKTPPELFKVRLSKMRNLARRMLQKHPGLAPVLEAYAHGRHRKKNHWFPRPHVDALMDGAKVEDFATWLA